MLYAIRLLALGLAIAVALKYADGLDALRDSPVIGPGDAVLLIGVMVFLFGIGTTMLVAYAVWSRRDPTSWDEGEGGTPDAKSDSRPEAGG